jgi:hypothetical protein
MKYYYVVFQIIKSGILDIEHKVLEDENPFQYWWRYNEEKYGKPFSPKIKNILFYKEICLAEKHWYDMAAVMEKKNESKR